MNNDELAAWLADRSPDEVKRLTHLLPSPAWDMSQERQFIENLLCQRVNFFLVFSGIIMAAAVTVRVQSQLVSLLWFGFVAAILLLLPILRVQKKLDIILEQYLYKVPGHPAHLINEKANRSRTFLLNRSMRRLVGYAVAPLLALALLVAAVCASVGVLCVKA